MNLAFVQPVPANKQPGFATSWIGALQHNRNLRSFHILYQSLIFLQLSRILFLLIRILQAQPPGLLR